MHYKNEVSYITEDPDITASFQTMNYKLGFTIFDELFANFHLQKKSYFALRVENINLHKYINNKFQIPITYF